MQSYWISARIRSDEQGLPNQMPSVLKMNPIPDIEKLYPIIAYDMVLEVLGITLCGGLK